MDKKALQGLNVIAEEVYQLAREKGWYDGAVGTRNLAQDFVNIHAELSEAWEEYRKGHPPTLTYLRADGKPEGIPTELADVLIRVLDTMRHHGIDIAAAIERKHEFNKTRPYRHGGKLA